MPLIEQGPFISRNGVELPCKFDCDYLSDESIASLASVIACSHSIRRVFDIPRGGTRLARALERYRLDEGGDDFIIDDVWTTGRSMWEKRSEIGVHAKGIVIIAWLPPPPWVHAFLHVGDWVPATI